jgi:hypothetical protein
MTASFLRQLGPNLLLVGAIAVSAALATGAALLLVGGMTPNVSAVPHAADVTRATPTTAGLKPKPATPVRPNGKKHAFLIAATRGDCWLSARKHSATGEVLYEGILAQGRSVRLTAERLWLSIGAAGNLDVTIDGKPLEDGLRGTVETVLPAASQT